MSTVAPASAVPSRRTVEVASSALSAGAVKTGAPGAVRSTVNVLVAGDGSRVPAALTARMATVWLPTASTPVVNGETQAA